MQLQTAAAALQPGARHRQFFPGRHRRGLVAQAGHENFGRPAVVVGIAFHKANLDFAAIEAHHFLPIAAQKFISFLNNLLNSVCESEKIIGGREFFCTGFDGISRMS
jgi:hypothetical protein